MQRAGTCFGEPGLPGMRDSTEKPQVHGGDDHCWPVPLEKVVAKARSALARESPQLGGALEASEPLHRWAPSARGLSLGSRSGTVACWPVQCRPCLAPWCQRPPVRSGDLGPSRVHHISALRGDWGRSGTQDAPSPAHSPWTEAPGPPQ